MPVATTPPLFPPCGPDRLRIGLGGAPLGNLFTPVPDADAAELLRAAIDSGCRSFDTAPHYGHGLSERRIGDALRPLDRAQVVLSSKVGRLLTAAPDAPRAQHGYVDGLPFVQHWDYGARGVRRSLEDTLQRCGLARIDVLYVHDCDAATHGDRAPQVLRRVIDETLPELAAIKREGLIGGYGLGVNDVRVVLDVLARTEIDALLIAGRYSLLDHGALAELLPACLARGVHVALGGVFNSGILATGSAGRNGVARFDYGPAGAQWIARTRRIEAHCAEYGVPLRAAALQFVLAHPAIEIVMLGARSAAEWLDALAMLRHAVPAGFWQALRADRLIPDQAPTP